MTSGSDSQRRLPCDWACEAAMTKTCSWTFTLLWMWKFCLRSIPALYFTHRNNMLVLFLLKNFSKVGSQVGQKEMCGIRLKKPLSLPSPRLGLLLFWTSEHVSAASGVAFAHSCMHQATANYAQIDRSYLRNICRSPYVKSSLETHVASSWEYVLQALENFDFNLSRSMLSLC